MSRKRFLFDLDDTLIWTTHDYSWPLLDFASFVIKRLGPKTPNVPAILNLQESLDSKRMKRWIKSGKGFCKERFPTSMAEAYQKICEQLKIEDEEGVAMAYEIGTQAFSMEMYKKKGMVPDAEDILNNLRGKGNELFLFTKGEMEIQEMKINANNLESMFDEIHIVPDKNKEIIESYVGNYSKSDVWLVGDSKDSDVLPSIEAGIGIIYLPMPNWKGENSGKKIPKYDRLITLDKISDIMDVYDRL